MKPQHVINENRDRSRRDGAKRETMRRKLARAGKRAFCHA